VDVLNRLEIEKGTNDGPHQSPFDESDAVIEKPVGAGISSLKPEPFGCGDEKEGTYDNGKPSAGGRRVQTRVDSTCQLFQILSYLGHRRILIELNRFLKTGTDPGCFRDGRMEGKSVGKINTSAPIGISPPSLAPPHTLGDCLFCASSSSSAVAISAPAAKKALIC
jgi:hypothetical protein